MEGKSKLKKCELCLSEATCLCYECMTYYCDSCFILVHKNEERKSHEKQKIDCFVPVEVKCPEHKLVPLNLFCVDDKSNLYNFLIIFL